MANGSPRRAAPPTRFWIRRPARRSAKWHRAAPRTSTSRSEPRATPSSRGLARRRASEARSCTGWRMRSVRQHRRAIAPRVPQRGQARFDRRLRDGPHARQLAFLRLGGALSRRQGRGRVRERLHVDDSPRAARRHRVHRAMELSTQYGDVEARPGARRRQHGGAQNRRSSNRSPR